VTDPRTAEAQVWLGISLARSGRASEAKPLLEAGHARLEREPHFQADAVEASRALASLPGV
jgi:hypothetical protein